MSEEEAGENRDAHAQWSAICDYCGNTAGHYCKTCGIKLCFPCKDDHLSKRIYRHHEAIPYSTGIGPKSSTESECSNHPGERYQLFCEPCKVPVCSSCIVQKHRKHEFCSVSDAYDIIKRTAMSQLQTISQTIRPRLQKELDGLSKSQEDILSAIAEIERRMKDSAQHIHKEVDDILAENMKKILKMKDDTIMPLLQEEVRKTKENLGHFDEEILSYDKHLRSVDPVDLLKFMKEQDEHSLDVASNQIDALLLLPSFTPGRISRESLQQQFGELVTMDHSKPSTTSGISYSGETKGDNSDSDHNTENVTNKQVDNKVILKLIPNPVCETELTMKYRVWGLRLRSPNEAWVHCGHGTTEFDLLERSGNVVRTMDAGCRLYGRSDMCVTDDGGLVYSDRDNRCIRSLSPRGQVSTLFTTEGYTPLGLCRLMSGELVVGMWGGVIRLYSSDGRVVREIKSKHVNDPNYITINKQTEDIWVLDNWKKVAVFKKNGHHRFTYTGHGSDSRFTPCDLCSDRQGRLLITDCDNHRIHIVDQDGQFIQYLATQKDGIQYPVSIDVDDRGHAWVGEVRSYKVKFIRYLQ